MNTGVELITLHFYVIPKCYLQYQIEKFIRESEQWCGLIKFSECNEKSRELKREFKFMLNQLEIRAHYDFVREILC